MTSTMLLISFCILLTTMIIPLKWWIKRGHEKNDKLIKIMSSRQMWYGGELVDECRDFLVRGELDTHLACLEKKGLVASRQECPTQIAPDGRTRPGKTFFTLTNKGYDRVEQLRS